MSEGKLLVDDFSFDREFNQSVATKIIVKQRILKDWYIFNTKHSETYFISKDGQILLISFYCGFKRVETRRIFWSKKNNNITYEELIEKFTKENSYEYIYSEEHDISKLQLKYEFCQIQKIAREVGSIPYRLFSNNCNFSTLALIKELYPEENIKCESNKLLWMVQTGYLLLMRYFK